MTKANAPVIEMLTALADDELVIGHRDSEWTGYAPILEEDIAFSNIAQDEIGHSLVWYTLLERLLQRSPDAMAFERQWLDFRCCRFVAYPRGDFAYTVVRQYLFDEAEHVRLEALAQSSYGPIRDAAARIMKEEAYHLLHSEALVERLGDATDESRRRMHAATATAFPQSLGLFERLEHEDVLVRERVFPGNAKLQTAWIERIVATFGAVSITLPLDGWSKPLCLADYGGRAGDHTSDLEQLIADLHMVYQSVSGASW